MRKFILGLLLLLFVTIAFAHPPPIREEVDPVVTVNPTAGMVWKADASGVAGWRDDASGGSPAWGSITGTISAQTDLSGALDGKLATGGTAANSSLLENHNTAYFAPALGADDNYVTDAEKTVIGNTSNTNTGDNTNFAPPLGSDDNYVTDAEKVVIGNTSGANTGDNTVATSGDSATAFFSSGTFDGDLLPAPTTTKRGGVPATGTPSGKYLKDDGTWATVEGGSGLTQAQVLARQSIGF